MPFTPREKKPGGRRDGEGERGTAGWNKRENGGSSVDINPPGKEDEEKRSDAIRSEAEFVGRRESGGKSTQRNQRAVR